MLIKTLKLRNFKCHKDLTVNFADGTTTITGANGSGKTSVADAFYWLLTGKDSSGRQEGDKDGTNLRPLGLDGEKVHDLNVEVEAAIVLDNGVRHVLKRVFLEKYRVGKNTGERTLEGNTTDYFIDDVPYPAKKYEGWIKENIPPEQFKLTSDPAYFPTLHWTKQREWLLDFAGNITDEAVIAANENLRQLPDLLGGHTIEDAKKIAVSKLTKVNKYLKETIVRIDQSEKLGGLQSEEEYKEYRTALLGDKALADASVARAEADLATASQGGRKATLESKIKELEAKLEVFKQKRRESIREVEAAYREKVFELKSQKERAELHAASMNMTLTNIDETIKELETRVEQLYQKYDQEEAKEFDAFICPCCGQKLPPDKVEQLRAKFNLQKANCLEEIIEAGKRLKTSLQAAQDKKAKTAATLQALQQQPEDYAKADMELLYKKQAELKKVPELEDNKEFLELRDQLDAATFELTDLDNKGAVNLEPLKEAVMDARKDQEGVNKKLADLDAAHKTLLEIESLKAEKDSTREQADTLSLTLRLIKEFTLAKIQMIDESIKKLFPGLEWKLFTQNLSNDDIVDTCELLMHGVPYRDLSTGEKIKAGMIIVNVLSKRLGMNSPKFIDNAESITFKLETTGQVIYLMAKDNVSPIVVEEAK